MRFVVNRALLAPFFLCLFFELVQANCYLPNGTDINALRKVQYDNWLPCTSTTGGKVSMCCRTNGTDPDTCLSNGLCHNDVAPNLWRESCTDPTWQSPSCLQLCVSANAINTGNPNWPDGTPLRDAHVPITNCQDGSFCCGNNATSCCAAGQGQWIVNGQVTNSKPSSTSSSTSSSASTGTATAATAATTAVSSSNGSSPSPSGPRKSSSNAGAIAGGVVGGLAGLALIAGAVWFALRRRRKNAPTIAPAKAGVAEMEAAQAPAQAHELPAAGGAGYAAQDHKYNKPPAERSPGVTEIPGTHELPAR